MNIYSVLKIGLLTLSGFIIFGQLLMFILIDHTGWLGAEKIALNWQHILGGVVILLVCFSLYNANTFRSKHHDKSDNCVFCFSYTF